MSFDYDKTSTFYAIPDGTEIVPENEFAYCKALESVIIPDSAVKLGKNLFVDSPALKLIRIRGREFTSPDEAQAFIDDITLINS